MSPAEVEAAWALAEKNAGVAIEGNVGDPHELGKRIVRLCRAVADITSGEADERRKNAKAAKRKRTVAIANAKRR